MSSNCYNLYRVWKGAFCHCLYQIIPKTIDFILLNGLLNINAWFIWFGNLSGIYTQSGYNPYRMCQGIVDLASVAWESQFVNPQGGKIPISWHKKSSRDICNSYHKSCKSHRDLFEISLRDLIIKSSRDTHHHSASHILLCVSESSRDSLIKSSRDMSSYSHTGCI